MNVESNIQKTRDAISAARQQGKTIGLVPTMGAMHEGHLSLIRASKNKCDFTVVSIFVNPTQFGPSEDFEQYPRRAEEDLKLCEELDVDLIFMPEVDEMYTPDALTEVRVRKLSDTLCGRTRPTHFAGVCTVVAKLFNIVQPDRSFFGQKDYQQATILRKMAADLNFPVAIDVQPIVREEDGLAMSSRNKYLNDSERKQAKVLYEALQLAKQRIEKDHPPADDVIDAMLDRLSDRAPLGAIDYIQIVDPQTLEDVENTDKPVLVALAVKFSSARLIDNILVE